MTNFLLASKDVALAGSEQRSRYCSILFNRDHLDAFKLRTRGKVTAVAVLQVCSSRGEVLWDFCYSRKDDISRSAQVPTLKIFPRD